MGIDAGSVGGRRRRWGTVLVLVAAGGLAATVGTACTPPNVAPELPTYADAQGKDVAPLTVDWPAGRRGDLEVAMRTGLPLVRFDATGFELLDGCRVPGSYGFIATSVKEEVLRFENSTEVMANLPLGGAGILKNVGGELGQKTALDVGLVMVGKRVSTRQEGTRAEVEGPAKDCARATHFVRGVTVGAFALSSGASGQAKAVATLFAVDTSASAKSDKKLESRDGSLAACRASSNEGLDPPNGCAAVLRLDLRPLDGSSGGSADCPKGLVLVKDKCTSAKGGTFVCGGDDAKVCSEQCDAGNGPSCAKLSLMLNAGKGELVRDFAKARVVAERGCERGDDLSCTLLANHLADGSGITRDLGRARDLYEAACARGNARGCFGAARLHHLPPRIDFDIAAALKLYRRACDGGSEDACNNLGLAYLDGDGVEKDQKKAVAIFDRACTNGGEWACGNLGRVSMLGWGIAKDTVRGKALLDKACSKDVAFACHALAYSLTTGFGVAADPDAAPHYWRRTNELLTRECEGSQGDRCAMLGQLVMEGAGVPRDDERALKLFTRGCELGSPGACAGEGLAYQWGRGTTADPRKAADLYAKACEGGDGGGCAHLALLHENGLGVAKDQKQRDAYATRACELHAPEGCYTIARMLSDASDRDTARIVKLLEDGCEHGYGLACTSLAEGTLEGGRKSMPQEQRLALHQKGCEGRSGASCTQQAKLLRARGGVAEQALLDLMQKGCFLGDASGCAMVIDEIVAKRIEEPKVRMLVGLLNGQCMAGNAPVCVMVGELFRKGAGVPKDGLHAFSAFRTGCERGHDPSCMQMAIMELQGDSVARDVGAAATKLDTLCGRRVAGACARVGRIYELGEGGVSKDPDHAVAAYRRGCDRAEGEACLSLGKMAAVKTTTGPKQDLEAALHFEELACRYGKGEGCHLAARAYELGQGTKPSPEDAVRLYTSGCRGDFLASCQVLVDVYRRGRLGKAADREIAERYRAAACRLGDEKSCK